MLTVFQCILSPLGENPWKTQEVFELPALLPAWRRAPVLPALCPGMGLVLLAWGRVPALPVLFPGWGELTGLARVTALPVLFSGWDELTAWGRVLPAWD